MVDLGDGNRTHLEVWGESGPVLLCVHGIGSSRKSWARTADYFAANYRVCAYDQRGHGDSAAVTGPMSLERCAADLEAVAQAVGSAPLALIGHSWGGAVVLTGGRRIPCRGVVAVDPMIRVAPGTWAAEYVVDVEPILAVAPNARAPVIREFFESLPPVEIAAKVHAMRDMTIETLLALGDDNEVDAGKWDLREVVRGYPKPLRLLLADPAESVVAAEDLAFVRERGGPNVSVEVFDGEGHTLHRTAFDRFAGEVAAFLRAVAARE